MRCGITTDSVRPLDTGLPVEVLERIAPALRRLAFAISVFAGAPVGAQTHAFHNYGAEAGVPVATAIAFDANGALIVGTNDGLVRFDGFGFEPVPLVGVGERRVTRLTAAPDGSVWGLITPGGLLRLDARNRVTIEPFPAGLREHLAQQRSWHRLRVDADGGVWINELTRGLWRFDPISGRWARVDLLASGHIIDFFFENREALWVATPHEVTRVRLQAGSPTTAARSTPYRDVVWVRPHPTGGAWVGTGAGVYLLSADGSSRRILSAEYQAWVHAEPASDAAGRLLLTVGYAHGQLRRLGVMRLGTDGSVEFPRAAEPGLHGYTPRQLLFGREGDFWLAHEGGLIHVEQEHLVSHALQSPDGTIELAKELVEDRRDRDLWISTWGGMYRLRGGRVLRVSSLPRRATTGAVLSRDGSAWWMEHEDLGFASSAGRLMTATERTEHLVFETRAGVRFVARPNGFYRRVVRDAVRISTRRFVAAPAAESQDGRIWLSPAFHGVDTVEGDSLASDCVACVAPSIRAIVDTLRDIEVDEMRADAGGHVWIAAGRFGLICLFRSTGGDWVARRLGVPDGLLSNLVTAVAPTADGRLWVGTSRGLQEFRVGGPEARLEPGLQFRARDGMDGEAVTAIVEDSAGVVWFASTPGKLYRLDYRHIPSLASPPVRVARIETDGAPRDPGTGPILLRAEKGRLALQLAPQSYRQLGGLRLQYRVAPLDTAWIDLGATRSVRIAALPPGRHTFEARAVRPGRPPGPILRQAFVAEAPVYRRPWFILAAGGVLLLSPALWYRSRFERQLAMERLRMRIATDLHDDLGAGLTQVSLYSELIRRASKPEVAAWADRVGKEARSLSEGLHDIVWAIDPQHESWESLELRMKDYAAALLAPHEIAFDMQVTDARASTTLPTEVRRNVLLLFKEALHNAVRHAHCRRIEVRCRLSPSRLWLSIRDDGRGFDPSGAARGNGLLNVRRRAAEIGAEVRVDSAVGRGTSIEVDVPLDRSPSARNARGGYQVM